MTKTTRKILNPSGYRGEPRPKVKPGTTFQTKGRTLKIAPNRVEAPKKRGCHIPGHPLDLDLRINTGYRAPTMFGIDLMASTHTVTSRFTPSLDQHAGIFWNGSEEELHEIVENIVSNPITRNHAATWEAPARIIDLTPNGDFTEHNFAEKVITKSYYSHQPGEELEVIDYLYDVLTEIKRRCESAKVTSPPSKHYDLIILWVTAEQAEHLAEQRTEKLNTLLEEGGTYHIPLIFFVMGDPLEADTFTKMLTKALFLGERNKEYIYETLNEYSLETTGKPIKVYETLAHRYPLGYEPIWKERQGKFTLATLYTLKSHGMSLKGVQKAEAQAHNKTVWNDFLSSLPSVEQ